MKKYLKRLLLMFQFLTTIPIPIRLQVNDEDFGKGLIFAPIVGLALGGILAGTFYLLSIIFPVLLSAVITFVGYIMLTGGLHLDGLGDTFDGLFSNRPKERMLEIMRDSRVGTNAVLAVASLLLVNVTALSAFPSGQSIKVLLLMPVAGRIGSLLGAGLSSYARSGEGLGKSFIDFCGVREVILGGIPAAAIFFVVAGFEGLFLSIIPFISAFLLVKFFSRKIGGATGDILGAVCELNQCIFLLTAFLYLKT